MSSNTYLKRTLSSTTGEQHIYIYLRRKREQLTWVDGVDTDTVYALLEYSREFQFNTKYAETFSVNKQIQKSTCSRFTFLGTRNVIQSHK